MAFAENLDVITSTVTLTAQVTMNDLGRLSLDFSGYQVDGVQVDDQYTAFYRNPDKIYIDLPNVFMKGDPLILRVSYHGHVTPVDSQYISGIPLGLRTIPGNNLTFAFGEPDGAHIWFPCNDHPLDKASYSFKLTVPAGFTGVANGTLLNETVLEDKRVFLWSEKYPMAPYLATVLVGKYQRIDAPQAGDVLIRHYVLEGDSDYSSLFGETQNMLDYFSELIAPYPFDEFGFVVIRTLAGEPAFAEETQTMVLVDRDNLQNQQAVGVLAHELAHHWFGDAVSLSSWNEVWLKEGLATYLMVLWLDDQGYVSLTDLMSNLEDILVSHASALNFPLNQPPYDAMYGPGTYNKGAWVYHMLHQQIGDEKFTAFLREYYRRYNGKQASTADLQSLVQEISGLDLSTFFDEWVYGSGIPTLALTWVSQPDEVTVQVCQVGGGQVYTLPLEMELQQGKGASQLQVMPVDQLQEQATYTVSAPLTALIADPQQDILADISVTEVDVLASCEQ
jgi:aminopeptidase N